MQMFGVDQEGATPLKMGFGKNDEPCPISQFDLYYRVSILKFKEMFIKLASNPAGRILLYRLLIEIRRTKGESGAPEMSEFCINPDDRNKCRTIRFIDKSNFLQGYASYITLLNQIPSLNAYNQVFSFNGYDNVIQVSLNQMTSTSDLCNLGMGNNGEYYAVSRLLNGKTDNSVHLFHEMLHWFHFLRYTDRYVKNREGEKENTPRQYGSLVRSFYSGRVEYWTGKGFVIQPYKKDVSDEVDVEEMRTVFGSSTIVHPFFNGDDLSENLYRCFLSESGQTHAYMRCSYDFLPKEFIIKLGASFVFSLLGGIGAGILSSLPLKLSHYGEESVAIRTVAGYSYIVVGKETFKRIINQISPDIFYSVNDFRNAIDKNHQQVIETMKRIKGNNAGPLHWNLNRGEAIEQ
jgi:hypothetical protein